MTNRARVLLCTAVLVATAQAAPPAPVLARKAPAPQLDRTEVTALQFGACVAAGKCTTDGLSRSDWGPAELCNWGKQSRAKHPVNCVSWPQAQAYCAFAGERLPTEQEWDAGAGGSEQRAHPWGNQEVDKQLCWGRLDSDGTCAVGSFPAGATPAGLQDLAGNVSEWTASRFCTKPAGCGSAITVRGGAWGGGWAHAVVERFGAGFRDRFEPSRRGSYLGLRCISGGTAPIEAAPAPAHVPQVLVELHVLTSAAAGNPLWTEAHAKRVLAKASSLMHSEVQFKLASYQRFVDEAAWRADRQAPLLADFSPKVATWGRVSVTISTPHAVDYTGFSREWSGTKDFEPMIVMRSRKNDGSEADVYETAAIFLHELGHTLGFAHDGTIQAMPYPADGYWDLPAARDVLVNLAGWFELHAKGASPRVRATQFKCAIGAPVPETHLLFDPPTNAPSEDECAVRCASIADCVAYARPTWDNARCLLFGHGAKVVKDPGWNNVDTCWRR